jgi:phage terminase large subunit
MKVRFEVGESVLPLWERQDYRYAIIMGGRGFGRSGTASRFAVSQLLSKEYTRGALMRATREDIRASCWSEIIDRVNEQGIADSFRIVDNDMFIERGMNSLRGHGFKASSGSLTARLKSLANYNFIWAEEAEEIGEKEFMTLDDSLRTVKGRIRIVLTLNTPPKNHWIIKRWFDLTPHPEISGFYIPTLKPEYAKEVLFIGGNYRDNLPNLAPHTVTQYERYRDTNPVYYWQMIEGLSPEVVMGRIYQGWREIPSVPHEARLLGYGLDFGFDPDPAAIVAIYWHNGGYILDEKLYANNLTNQDLATHLKLLPQAPIIADSAEPKSIEELRRLGISVLPTEKGADSVRAGIKHVQGKRISYTATSPNLIREYENYAWKVDKDGNQQSIEDPRCDNHLMSAARYFMMMMVKGEADPEHQQREAMKYVRRERELRQQASQRHGL